MEVEGQSRPEKKNRRGKIRTITNSLLGWWRGERPDFDDPATAVHLALGIVKSVSYSAVDASLDEAIFVDARALTFLDSLDLEDFVSFLLEINPMRIQLSTGRSGVIGYYSPERTVLSYDLSLVTFLPKKSYRKKGWIAFDNIEFLGDGNRTSLNSYLRSRLECKQLTTVYLNRSLQTWDQSLFLICLADITVRVAYPEISIDWINLFSRRNNDTPCATFSSEGSEHDLKK
jgi:hypothetical protein